MSNDVEDALTLVRVKDESSAVGSNLTPQHSKLTRAPQAVARSNASMPERPSMTDIINFARMSSPPPGSSPPSSDCLTYVKKMQAELRAMGDPHTAEERDWLQATKTAVDKLASDIDTRAAMSADAGLRSKVLELNEQITDRNMLKGSVGGMSHNL